jgi:hypothetical protein
MTVKEIDALVRENSLTMLGNDRLNSRYVTACNMLLVASRTSSAAFLRLKPEDIKPGKTPRGVTPL